MAPDLWASTVVALNRYRYRAPADPSVRAAKPAEPGTDVRALLDSAAQVTVSGRLRRGQDGDDIVVSLRIADGYHVNANPATLDYLIATRVTFDDVTATSIRYPASVAFKPDFADQAIDVYEGGVDVVARFPPGTLVKGMPVRGTATVQACDDKICLPPADLSLTFPVD